VVAQKLYSQQILQGKMYDYLYPAIKGHQFFGESAFRVGTVTFEGITYKGILLKYDNYNNLLVTIIEQGGWSKLIILDNSRINSFEINDQMFINITNSTHILGTGYYMSAYQGTDIQLFVKVEKMIVGNTGRPGDLLQKFFQKESHILVERP